MTFFTEVGKAVCAQLGTARTSALMSTALNSHMCRPRMAHDALPRGLRPRGGYDQEDPNNGGGPYAFGSSNGNGGDPDDVNCIDSESCTLFVKKLILGLDPDERDKFLENMANMLQSDDATQWAGGGGVNASAMDRSRRRGSRDTGTRQPHAMDRGRRPAQDSNTTMLNQKGFDSRWGDLTRKIDVWACGRRFGRGRS